MPVSVIEKRLGFHYYPDTLHYRQEDINIFLPRLLHLGASWITLQSHSERTIPEPFLQALIENNITPIVHIKLPIQPIQDFHNIRLLLQAYANWGVKFITLFDRPNLQISWDSSRWSQSDLVERFLDYYLPAAEIITEFGMNPVFPPLEPGGDYWDTVFLQSALRGIIRRGYKKIVNKLTLSSYGWTFGHDLEWGFGGSDNWPDSHPYDANPNTQDQRGFRIFDWYLSISKAVFGYKLPLIVLAAGDRNEIGASIRYEPSEDQSNPDHTQLQVYKLIEKSQVVKGLIPSEVIACNIWLLAATEDQPEYTSAWFPDGSQPQYFVNTLFEASNDSSKFSNQKNSYAGHYLLFPEEIWHPKSWLHEIIQPLRLSPFVSFGSSIQEAMYAKRITIIGKSRWLDETVFRKFSASNCIIEEIYGDGILIATKINEIVNLPEVP